MHLASILASLLSLCLVASANNHGSKCSFDLTLTWEKHAPDGFARDMILVNGQYPGPLLDIKQGQHVTVNIHNKMPFNTSVHFHGEFLSLTLSLINKALEKVLI
jgi:FtsP/CotA-like multicopper oxidase with cupredoxin domain